MYDVQLQVAATGSIVWAQTFSDEAEAERYQSGVEHDLDTMDEETFRRKWSVPSTA